MHHVGKKIVQRLQDAGHIAYFAGGWVRDFLLGAESDDLDIVTSASVEEIVALFAKTIPIGAAFGIVMVVEEGHTFEIATFRKEGPYDGRRPAYIVSATPEEDAQRRDFTINGLFFDPITAQTFDFVNGLTDLKQGIVRAIGNPEERFAEDRLRMVRAVRYTTRFSMLLEEKTADAIRLHASELRQGVSIERIWKEFEKMAVFDRSMILLHRLNLLGPIFPELGTITMSTLEERVAKMPHQAPVLAKILCLFPEESDEAFEALAETWKLSRADRTLGAFLLHARRQLSLVHELQPEEWVAFYASPHAKLALQLYATSIDEHHTRQQTLSEPIERRKAGKTLLTADHLLKAGWKEGPELGVMLQKGEVLAIRQGLRTAEEVLRRLK